MRKTSVLGTHSKKLISIVLLRTPSTQSTHQYYCSAVDLAASSSSFQALYYLLDLSTLKTQPELGF
jgi:hypothetical protein